MLVPSDVGVTAGAAMGHLDLALWLIRKVSPELATLVSRYLLADIRSSQALYIIPNHLAQADPLILRFERWAREHLQEGFSLQEAAKALATSARSLQRRCQAVLGKSPLAYFQDSGSNARNLSFTAAASTSTPSQLRSVTSTEPLYERSCVSAWDGECAIFVPICADGRRTSGPKSPPSSFEINA